MSEPEGEPEGLSACRLLCARHANWKRVFRILNVCSQQVGFNLRILIGSRTNKCRGKCIWSAFYQPNDPNHIVTPKNVIEVANRCPMYSRAVVHGPTKWDNNHVGAPNL